MLIHMFTAPGEHVIFTWKFLSVTQEGLDMGLKMAARLIFFAIVLFRADIYHFTDCPDRRY